MSRYRRRSPGPITMMLDGVGFVLDAAINAPRRPVRRAVSTGLVETNAFATLLDRAEAGSVARLAARGGLASIALKAAQ